MSLFGLDLSGLTQGVLGAGRPSITLETRRGGSLATGLDQGRDHQIRRYTCSGYVDTSTSFFQGPVIEGTDRIRIYRASLPAGVAPQARDAVIIDAVSYEIESSKLDTSGSVFEIVARGRP